MKHNIFYLKCQVFNKNLKMIQRFIALEALIYMISCHKYNYLYKINKKLLTTYKLYSNMSL